MDGTHMQSQGQLTEIAHFESGGVSDAILRANAHWTSLASGLHGTATVAPILSSRFSSKGLNAADIATHAKTVLRHCEEMLVEFERAMPLLDVGKVSRGLLLAKGWAFLQQERYVWGSANLDAYSLLRVDHRYGYDEANTISAKQGQVVCIEMARMRRGLVPDFHRAQVRCLKQHLGRVRPLLGRRPLPEEELLRKLIDLTMDVHFATGLDAATQRSKTAAIVRDLATPGRVWKKAGGSLPAAVVSAAQRTLVAWETNAALTKMATQRQGGRASLIAQRCRRSGRWR